MMNRLSNLIVPFAIAGMLFQACKKDSPITEAVANSSADAQELLLMDSTYLLTYTYSLWNSSMPEPKRAADLRSFVSPYKTAEEVLDALKALTPKIGPAVSNVPQAVDRFSFIDRTNRVGEQIGQGVYRDLGLSLQALIFDESTREVGIVIRLVQKNSPAIRSGLSRGLRILSVDGEMLRLTADSDNSIQGNLAVANRLNSGNVSTVRVRDLNNGSERDVNIAAGNGYTLDPILEKKVIELPNSGKKVGYLAYTSFISVLTNRQPNSFHRDLTSTFDDFAAAGIQELVVDLRYNGGGETNAAQLLTNLIVPAGNNGKMMYAYVVNDVLKSAGWTDANAANAPFKPVSIHKTNALNLTRVYFLVTAASASASELVINSLKPYMNVQIISTQGRGTYGKPVGASGRPVMNDAARLYVTSFKMTNAANEGDYFLGLMGEKKDSRDGLSEPLGSVDEQMFSDALNHITTGAYTSRTTAAQARTKRGNQLLSTAKSLDIQLDQQIQGLYHLE